MTYIKASLLMLGNVVSGGQIKPAHSDDYNRIKKEVMDLRVPTQRMDKKNLHKDRIRSVSDLKKAFDKLNG